MDRARPAIGDAEGVGIEKAAAATSTAARPTSEWKAATSCGIAVIAIRRAVTKPIAAPIAIAARISPTACIELDHGQDLRCRIGW